MAEARKLAAEYRRATGKTLPISGEIAINDAIRLLALEPVNEPTAGYDAIRRNAEGGVARLQIKARVVFDEIKSSHRVGELKLDRRAGARSIDECGIGKADIDAPIQSRDRRIGAIYLAVRANGLDALQIVGVGKACARYIAQRGTILFD